MPADSPMSVYERLRYWARKFADDEGRMPSLDELLVYVRERQSIAGPRRSRMPVSVFPHRSSTGAFGYTIGVVPFVGVVGYGPTPADALATAASVAADVHGVLQEHPELEAVLPPGTALALKGIAAASQAIAHGHTLEDVRKVIGPKTARTIEHLLSLF